MIMPMHKPYFVLPGGGISPYYKISSEKTHPIVIQNPYFGFDFYGQEICKEKYNFNSTTQNIIRDFIALSEKNSNLNEDQILWAFTGYWTISSEDSNYIGMGIDALESTIESIKTGYLVFCLDNSDSCLFIKYNIGDASLTDIEIDIYALSLFRPWIEILHPFRRTISEMSGEQYNKDISVNHAIMHKRFAEYGKEGFIFPYAITPTEERNWIGPCIIRNSFINIGVDFIYTQANGGWLKTDFFKPSKCYFLSGKVFSFDDTIVVRGMTVIPSEYKNIVPKYSKEYIKYQELIDRFEE